MYAHTLVIHSVIAWWQSSEVAQFLLDVEKLNHFLDQLEVVRGQRCSSQKQEEHSKWEA